MAEEEKYPKKFSLSALQKAARENSHRQGYPVADVRRDAHLWLSGAWHVDEALTLPLSHEWDESNPPPLDVLARLVGREIRAPILVDYLGKNHLVVFLHFPREVERKMRIGRVITRDDAISVEVMWLVDADLVDMDVRKRRRKAV